jgi:hypothetical protein
MQPTGDAVGGAGGVVARQVFSAKRNRPSKWKPSWSRCENFQVKHPYSRVKLTLAREDIGLSKGHCHEKAPIEAPQDVEQHSVVQPTANHQSETTVNVLASDLKVLSLCQENAM